MYPENNSANQTSRKKVIILIALAAAAIITLLIASSLGSSEDAQSPEEIAIQRQEQQTGPESNSGQTAVSYTGFAELAQRGVTSYQMDGLRYALFQFSKDATTFAIDPNSIKQAPYDRDNPTDFVQMTFTIKVDDASYNARIDKYADLTTIRVYLSQADGKAVFDSQPIDSAKLSTPSTYVGD